MIIVIMFFFAFSTRSANPAAQASKPKGSQNRSWQPCLNSTCGSAGQALEVADPASRVRRAADPLALGLQPGALVFSECPRLGKPCARCLHAMASASHNARWLWLGACGLPNAQAWQPRTRCPQPQGVCLQLGASTLQPHHAPTKQYSPQ